MTSLNLNIENINKGYEDALSRGLDTPKNLYDGSFVSYLKGFIQQPFTQYGLTQFKGLHEAAYTGILIAEACKVDKLEIEHLEIYHKAYIQHPNALFKYLSDIPISDSKTYDFYPRFLHLIADSLCDHQVSFISPKSVQLVSNIKDLSKLTAVQTATLLTNALTCARTITNPQNIGTLVCDEKTISIVGTWLNKLPGLSQIKKALLEVSKLGLDIVGNHDLVLNIVNKSGVTLANSTEPTI